MLIKQIQFQGLEKKADGQMVVNCLPLFCGFEKTAAAGAVDEMRSKLHPAVQDFIKGIIPTPAGIYVLVNALGAGEYWGSNVNGDLFPEKALIHSPPNWDKLSPEEMRQVGSSWKYGFPTFMRAYPYKHHVNKDPSRAFGRVELAVWNPKMKRVELVVYLDRALCMKFDAMDVIERIERGEFPDVSMGCKVPGDICTICENFAKTTANYCVHAKTMLNKILPDGRKVAVRNDEPAFFDISFVFIGADKTAKVMAKLAQKGNQVCMGDYCTLARPSAEVGNVFSKTASIWGSGENEPELTPEQLERARKVMLDYAYGRDKSANGDMLQYYADHPEKLKEKQERDRKKTEKVANDPIKKKIEVQGVPIWIEWKKGETRLYKKGKVVKYERLMKADYGYIPDTKDADGEEIDVYVGPDKNATTAYVIDQLKKDDGSFDEHKVMIGYSSEKKARESYDYHMGGTVEFFGGIKPVPVSALQALFGKNGGNEDKKIEKKASDDCGCHGLGDDCGGNIETLLQAVFPMSREKSASHRKVSELIKTIPAGPFTRETLPRLEKTERDIPRDVLDLMGNMPLSKALSTPAMAGMILKPREFQRVVLIRIGEGPLADDLDDENMTFKQTKDVDESVPMGIDHVDPRLLELLSLMGLTKDRGAAEASLKQRVAKSHQQKPKAEPQTIDSPTMKKLAALYNGYRRSIIKKATQIQQHLTLNPQLRSDVFGSGMAKAFAGGVEKVSSASVFGPNSLAYLVGAYTDRDFHLTSKEAVASLAQTGAVAEAA